MSNSSMAYGSCVPPFLDEALFPNTGGYLDLRLCMKVLSLPHEPVCCLPCPATDWLYPESFKTKSLAAEWLNIMGVVLLLFMMLSYLVLPVASTRRHYLSTCLVLSIIMVCIGFIIPLAAQPDQCYDQITPNDMRSSMECAWSGSFLVAGGLCTTMWIMLRALSMNLQICWDIVPGRRFFYAAQIVGWGVPAIFFTLTMILTGVSFRFGNACHVNHQNALGVFWIPLLVMVGIAIIAQLYTFAYCMRVYLKSLWSDTPANSTSNSSGLPTHNGSFRAQTARVVFQRLKKVLFLQWRGLGIVSIILIDVIFFSTVFVHVDKLAQDALSDFTKTEEWILCLVAHPNDSAVCNPLVNKWLINVETIEAVLFLFGLAGLQCFLMMTRPTFFTAWYEFFQQKLKKRQEFISLDAQSKADAERYDGGTSRPIEMKTPGDRDSSSDELDRQEMLHLNTKEIMLTSTLSSPDEAYKSPSIRGMHSPIRERPPGMSPPVTSQPSPPPSAMVTGWRRDADYFATQRHNPEERTYNAPARSFSSSRPPSRQGSIRESRDIYTRSGLGLKTTLEENTARR